MRNDYWECRHLGHSWDSIPVTQRPPWGVSMWFRCERCTTIRYDIINYFSGELMSRRYSWPDGYKMATGEKPSVEELRRYQFKLDRKRGHAATKKRRTS
jgi:hypothetical protein